MSTEKSNQESKSNKLYTLLTTGWIDVEKSLPESGKCVLIYSKNGGVAEGCFKNPGYFWEQWRWNATLTDEVTHWMELPKSPTCS